MPNRLALEQSPYLLQHKDNPVDWYPWGDAAFEKARREDKPIFLSIGYSTCHWCHVMEHESFENADLAGLLNEHFVSIKVDREERPDVDRVYMTFVQVTTGSGGWPMSVWLTPSLAPFYGGTYFPPTSRWGRPGFAEVLEEIVRVWREERGRVEQSAASIVERLRSFGGHAAGAGIPDRGVLDVAVREYAGSFDHARGGFGAGTKFPRPSELLFLLREHVRTGADQPRDMALTTLRAMALGGMRDHIGGGFHRYSVDAAWRVPHFEKMLYDQAQLVLAYLEAAQVTHDPFFADVATDTLNYVRRDLTHPEGGFYSAEDADSVPPELAHE
ncbi:MAG TPA: thioredoxin domain-containing protein, partial [Vicinamibacterales bacterium]|nr:thioredoxin domain-containing protein [Vicinamibacterales bacterium]